MGLEELLMEEQYSPADWGASVSYDDWSRKAGTSQIFIHWGGGPVKDTANEGNFSSEKAVLRGYEAYHLSKGWRGLAYDWAIGQSGRLYRVRGLGQSGATSGDVDEDGYSNNREGEAILCLIGEGQTPTKELLATLDRVVKVLGYKEVYGHQEAKGIKTACPGPNLMSWLKDFRNPQPVAKKKKTTKKTTKKTAKSQNWTEDIVASLDVWKRGQRGANVKRLQALLNLHKHSLKIDGMFGPRTEKAVEEYQSTHRLAVDGIVGKKTWTHLLTSDTV